MEKFNAKPWRMFLSKDYLCTNSPWVNVSQVCSSGGAA